MLDFFMYDIINNVHWKIIVLYGINLEKVGEFIWFDKNAKRGFREKSCIVTFTPASALEIIPMYKESKW